MVFDQNQLAAGRSEFALYAGVKAPRLIGGIRYTDDWAVSGYYRRGISDKFTFGVNAQAEAGTALGGLERSEEHTSELQSLMRISYAVFCLKKKNITTQYEQASYTEYSYECTSTVQSVKKQS